MTEVDLPEGSSSVDFRDPKIWKGEDGSYYAVVGNRPADGSGQILLFESPDGFHWKFHKVLCFNGWRYGRMWECPDFFELDGKRIMIGWLQNWDACNLSTIQTPWFGQMSLPRELSIKNGRLYQKPIRELEEMRRNEVRYTDITFTDTLKLCGIKGRRVDMELDIRPIDDSNVYQKFAVRFAQDANYHTAVSFRPHESILKIDRKFSGSRRAIIHQRRSLVKHQNGRLRLRLILDRFSAEMFVNDGEQVLSATIYTDQAAEGISFFCNGLVNMDVVKYDLM